MSDEEKIKVGFGKGSLQAPHARDMVHPKSLAARWVRGPDEYTDNHRNSISAQFQKRNRRILGGFSGNSSGWALLQLLNSFVYVCTIRGVMKKISS